MDPPPTNRPLLQKLYFRDFACSGSVCPNASSFGAVFVWLVISHSRITVISQHMGRNACKKFTYRNLMYHQ